MILPSSSPETPKRPRVDEYDKAGQLLHELAELRARKTAIKAEASTSMHAIRLTEEAMRDSVSAKLARGSSDFVAISQELHEHARVTDTMAKARKATNVQLQALSVTEARILGSLVELFGRLDAIEKARVAKDRARTPKHEPGQPPLSSEAWEDKSPKDLSRLVGGDSKGWRENATPRTPAG